MKHFTRWSICAVSLTAVLAANAADPVRTPVPDSGGSGDECATVQTLRTGEVSTYTFTVGPAATAAAAPVANQGPPAGVDISATRAYLRTDANGLGSEVVQPTLGQTVYFYADYAVSGGSGPVNVTRRATLNGVPVCESGSYQAPGSYTTWCVDSWVATAGTHTLQWVFDHTSSVAETDESNNSASKIITPAGLDIVAQRAFLKTAPSNGGTEVAVPVVGQTVFFHIEFSVVGSGSPVTVTMRALIDGPEHCGCPVIATPGNTYVTSCLAGWTVTHGTHTLQWDLDYGNTVAETNEGNNSASVTFTPTGGDTNAPIGNVVINAGNSYTGSTSVSLALSASDAEGSVSGYYLSTSPSTPTAAQAGWVHMSPTPYFSNTISYPLPPGDGLKTVYAWYKDAVGNVSAQYSDSITLDQTPPTNGTLTATPGPGRITLTWSGQTDATSGVGSTKLVFAVGPTPPADCSGPAHATTSPYIHTGLTPGQPYSYRVCAIDGVGNTSSGATATATPGPSAGPGVRNDVDGDGRADVFWWNPSTGQTSIWFMNGTSPVSLSGPAVPAGWAPAVAGDFDGDSSTDFFLRNASTGQTQVWLGWNGSVFASIVSGPTIPVDWAPVTAGDINGDDNADIFWHNGTTGETSIWFMNGATYANAVRATTVPTSWSPVLLGDFNGDTEADIFWRNPSTGETSLWMGWNGTTFAVQVRSITAPAVWVPRGAGDVSGDGFSDIFWQNTSTGQTSLWEMNGAAAPAFVVLTTVPTSWNAVAFGDYDADARTDIFWHNPSTGETSIWIGYNGTTFTTQVRSISQPVTWMPVHFR